MANPIIAGGVASPQSLYDEYVVTHSDQDQGGYGHHPIGTRGQLSDGRVFYYASCHATALTAGSFCMLTATTGLNIVATDDKIILTASSGNFAKGARTGIALHEADIETADIIKNSYAEGYLYFEKSTGLGTYYKIARHDSWAFDGTSTAKTLDLYDPIKVAAAATSVISFAKNPYSRCITSSTAQNEAAIGVSPIAVTASGAVPTDEGAASASVDTSYFWMQTWGPSCVEIHTTGLIPGVAAMSGGAADRVDIVATSGHTSNQTTLGGVETPHIGWGIVSAIAVAGETGLVDLRIRP